MVKGQLTRATLVGLDGFTALTAGGGGIALVTGLEGDRFPAALLRGSPFQSYVGPRLILAGLVGGSATLATVCMIRNPRLGAWASTLAGAVLMGWIAGEVLLLRAPEARSWAEAAYLGIGMLMAGLGLASSRTQTSAPPHSRVSLRRPVRGMSDSSSMAHSPRAPEPR